MMPLDQTSVTVGQIMGAAQGVMLAYQSIYHNHAKHGDSCLTLQTLEESLDYEFLRVIRNATQSQSFECNNVVVLARLLLLMHGQETEP